MYLIIYQNLLNLTAKVDFMILSSPQEKPHVSWFIGTKPFIPAKQNLEANMEGNHLGGQPIDHGLKTL